MIRQPSLPPLQTLPLVSNAPTLRQVPTKRITTQTKEVAGGRLASSAQPPRATFVFLPGLHPYRSHSPSHRAPSSTTQTRFWRASGALRLSARSPRTTGFYQAFQAAQLTAPGTHNSSNCPKCLKPNFAALRFFRHQTRHHAKSLALRPFPSHHRALCSAYRRHFEPQPILSGELQCFHLYDFSVQTEGFFPA